MKIRVLIVDDHALLRSGIRLLIGGQPDMVVVGEAADGAEAADRARQTTPDIVLMDLAMSGQGGIAAIPGVRKAYPPAKIVVLTMHDEAAYLRAALSAGAAGYVVKTAADTELLTAIRAVAGEGVFSICRLTLSPPLPLPAANRPLPMRPWHS